MSKTHINAAQHKMPRYWDNSPFYDKVELDTFPSTKVGCELLQILITKREGLGLVTVTEKGTCPLDGTSIITAYAIVRTRDVVRMPSIYESRDLC